MFRTAMVYSLIRFIGSRPFYLSLPSPLSIRDAQPCEWYENVTFSHVLPRCATV